MMKRASLLIVLALLLIANLRAEQPREIRVVQPWSKLTTLSDDQKKLMAEIHRKALADHREIDRRESREMMEVLTAEQQAEFRAIQDQETVQRKLKNAQQTTSNAPASGTTLPAIEADFPSP